MQVVGLPLVDAHNTKEQLAIQSQRERAASSSFGSDDDLNVLVDLVLQNLSFGELLVLVGGQPDAGKLARLEQEILWKKHVGGGVWMVRRGAMGKSRVGRCCLRRRVSGERMRS